MESIIIEGGRKLSGEVKIQGSKNAGLPILAACVLCRGEVILHNVPNIGDVETMLEILTSLGCKAQFSDNTVVIDSSDLTCGEVSEELMGKMRSSIMLMGALIAVNKKVRFSYPGGCDIGLRPIDLHLSAFKNMGADISEQGGFISVDGSDMRSAGILLDFPSVGATENIILSSVFTKGVTSVTNAAKEPEIIDLQNFLNSMGARVYGAGSNTVYIEGVEKLKGCEYTIIPDRIVTGTYMCAVSAASGDIFLRGARADHLKFPRHKLEESGLVVKDCTDGLRCIGKGEVKGLSSIITSVYPGFPTDMQPLFTAMLCKSEGVTIINETVFENRYRYTSQLMRMGADIRIEDRIAVINGKKQLSGAKMISQDLRGGAALIIAALGARGNSIIEGMDYVYRGYENICGELRSLQAEIKTI
ncbi:MAG: UDP-N-acetylglucosamine 1-carboxyvinyltransferase [Eubacteriaceae bacterium]|nr:UDP-N-acetylglucosamine 1-carboxyvinyltransferase [Eubacteriaceae bacterium]